MSTLFLAALLAVDPGVQTERQYASLYQLARQQRLAPRDLPHGTCRPGRRHWAAAQYGQFHGELWRIYGRSVVIADDHGTRFRIRKAELSEADRRWLSDLQRAMRIRRSRR